MKHKLFINIFAFIVGIGGFLSLISLEIIHFHKPTETVDPFRKEALANYETLYGQNITQEVQIFSPDGEFFSLATQGYLDIKTRELFGGDLFWSTELLQTKPDEIVSIPFHFDTYQRSNGDLKIGPLLIRNNGSNVAITRGGNFTEIFNQGHAIDIFYEGATSSFVLPSDMKVKVYDALMRSNTAQLFYSKLKKDFQMQSISSKLPDLFQEGIKWIQQKKEEIYNYANTSQKGILYFEDIKTIQQIKNIQDRFAIGLSQKEKEARKFSQMVTPFFKAIEALSNKESQTVIQNLDLFLASYKSPQFEAIQKNNPDIQHSWERFIKSHKSWLKTVKYKDTSTAFFLFWEHNNKTLSSLETLENIFFNIEMYIYEKQYTNAQQELLLFDQTLKNTSFENQNIVITRYRRLITEILKNHTPLQTTEIFRIHKQLVFLELQHHTDSDLLNELKLENSKDIMWFIQYFLKKNSVNTILGEIMNTYRLLDISNVEKTIGIEIFTPEEKNLINTISFMGNTTITFDGIKRIQDSRIQGLNEKAEILEIEQLRQKEKSEQAFIINDPNHIIDVEQLKGFFEANGSNISRINVINNYNREQGLYTEFSGIYREGKSISGNFFYDLQRFFPIKIGIETIDSIRPELLVKKWNLESSISDNKNPSTNNPSSIISQTNEEAIKKRYIAQETLRVNGLSTLRSNVTIINPEMTQFRVAQTLIQENVTASFIYNHETKTLSDIILKKNNQEFPLSIISLKLDVAFQHLNFEALKIK